MKVGTLSKVVFTEDYMINNLIFENYDNCCTCLFHILNEDMDAQEVSSKADEFMQKIKSHPLKAGRIFLSNIISKLNRLAAYIRHKEATRPGERSLWSKAKEKISHFIQIITHKLGQATDNKMIDPNKTKQMIDTSKKTAKAMGDNMKTWIINNNLAKRQYCPERINKTAWERRIQNAKKQTHPGP